MSPDHGRCQHKLYLLTCEEYDKLWSRTNGACTFCGATGTLHIDHDADAGAWAVRGLLCSRCNTALDSSRALLPDAAVADYLANPWYRTGLGLSSERPAEPPIGSHWQLPNGAVIHRIHRGWVRKAGPRPTAFCTTWVGLWYRYGPRGLQPVPALPPDGDDPVRTFMADWEIEMDTAARLRDDRLLQALEQGRSQAEIVRLTTYSRETVRQAVARASAHRRATRKTTP